MQQEDIHRSFIRQQLHHDNATTNHAGEHSFKDKSGVGLTLTEREGIKEIRIHSDQGERKEQAH